MSTWIYKQASDQSTVPGGPGSDGSSSNSGSCPRKILILNYHDIRSWVTFPEGS